MLGLCWFMLVYNGQSENQMDDLGVPWGVPPFQETVIYNIR